MNTSLAERENPPPRRKSCEACKTAKRRCDLAFPACSRCARRDIPCIYPGRQPTIPQDLIDEAFASVTYTNDIPLSLDGCSLCVTDFDLPDLPGPPTIAQALDVFDPQWDYIDIAPPCISLEPPSSGLIPRQSFTMTAARTRPPMPLSAVIASRLQFTIDVLKDIPKMMVVENQTPWSHKQLYKDGMPKLMQGKSIPFPRLSKYPTKPKPPTNTPIEAYSSCALHITKNSLNTPLITSLINTNIQTLLTSPVPTTPLETLAHTHALLLYQIMLFFSPDPHPQNLVPDLEASALSLLSCIYFPDPATPISTLPPTPEATLDFWSSWIFQESARRTVLFSFYLTQLYRLVHGEHSMVCDGRLGLVHSLYMSAHLWGAQEAGEFAVAWREKDHFIVGELNFGRLLAEAKAVDIDVFGRMLLVSYLGIEDAKAWFLARGAVL
ncbi:hypothetical protein BDV23DRAFT_191186 [Aspergillus alliaceus]|uniref:Zn(2)-C6 fungal-type domain-containing protein n=1 Tax=Petromyces alliaceus TaxID=209559 RepID=A0A5N7BTP7_PETAA|nr:hypothetical protein BDV23DRAFT_191186 [Aspergillus alliaceus]